MHKLHCRIKDLPGALERCLRVVRVRGYDLLAISATRQDQHLVVDLEVSEGRGLYRLLSQLEKLEECCLASGAKPGGECQSRPGYPGLGLPACNEP